MKFEKLGHIVKISKGKKHTLAPKKEQQNFRYIQIEDLRNNNNLKYTDEKGVEVQENDLIIAWDGANAGTIGFGLRGMIGSTLARLRINEDKEYNTDFIGYFLKGQFDYLRANATGATIPHIDRNSLESLKIPSIDFPEQYEIAKVLSKSEDLIKQRKESIDLLDQFLEGIFYEMFGDPVRNENKWDLDFFENVVAEDCPLTYGIVQPGEDFPNGIPIVRPVDLTETYIKRKGLKLINPKISDKFKRTVLKGFEILMCVRGTTGVVSIASKELAGCNVTRGIVPIWFSENYNSLFAYFLLKSTGVQKEIQKLTYGATLQQINLNDLRRIKLIKPSLPVQEKFATIAQSITNIKEYYKRSLSELENLFGSLNQRAFKGELEFKSIPQKEIGDPLEGTDLPEGELPKLTDIIKQSNGKAEVVIKEMKKPKEATTSERIQQIINQNKIYPTSENIEGFIKKYFLHNYFTLADLKETLRLAMWEYDYETLKEILFDLLRKGKLKQVFADAAFKSSFKESDADFHKIKELNEQMYLQQEVAL